MPAIFNGIQLDPLTPGNVSYLLWMLMGYMLVTAVLVVTLGRLGDMYGRVRIYNAGFAIFTVMSILLSLDPFNGSKGALWLIGLRVVQAIGGSMILANSVAIITDVFPAEKRGMALGINIVAGIAGSFLGPGSRRSAGRVELAVDLLGQRAGRHRRHRLGLPLPARHRCRGARRRSTGGATRRSRSG